jgi:6-pyruvoyltetrahydropterin/6-carboxytetrahydropterin synthase
MPYRSTKTFGHELGLSCCFRQWRAESHCRFLHGYALAIRLEFEAEKLDEQNWCVDFGDFESLRELLKANFDHKTIVARDDPQKAIFREMEIAGMCEISWVTRTGCEAFAEMIFTWTEEWLYIKGYAPRVSLVSVEISEHGANSAIYRR